jgi:ethanolaminephosphotransferase
MLASEGELGDTISNNNKSSTERDSLHKTPHNRHLMHVWCFEPECLAGNVLTQDGATQIKLHKYQPGQYTWLDLKLNPVWTWLTELLPMTLAPNLVSLYGGLHCLVAYLLGWYYNPNLIQEESLPSWVLLFNAYCLTVYYTFDCMDGKQARRTNTSSPIGQLFDHGLDCLCLLAHLSIVQTWLELSGMHGAVWYAGLQATLQFSFFVAQWEEFYTGILPHATGNLGVTEVNYGMAMASLLNAVLFKDRKAFYAQDAETVFPFLSSISLRFKEAILIPMFGTSTLQLRHLFCIGWFTMMSLLILLSIGRVMAHLVARSKGTNSSNSLKLQASALLKLVSPAAVALAPFFLPQDVMYNETRYISLAVGLAMCLITIKIIVFSMAKQAYGVFQGDAMAVLLTVVWISRDSRWKAPGIHLLWQLTTLYYVVRLAIWIRAALRQLCDRLEIELFRIKAKKE